MRKSVLAVAALAAAVMPMNAASAAQIVASTTGISNPDVVITFDEVVLPTNSLVTNEYAGFGVSFSPGLGYSPQTGFPNIQGATLGNFSPYIQGPYTLSFNTQQSDVAFAMVSNGTQYLFEALLGGLTVESFTSAVPFNTSANFFGFTGSAFDAIRITSLQSDSLLIDNLQLGSPGAVPEPGTWAMILLGFGAVGFSMRRSARRRRHLLQIA
jgi:PEP-CTERM motif